MQPKFQTVDEYISSLPAESRGPLEKLRKAIKQAAPKAEEVISYNMPAFKYHGMLVYYAAFKSHIGFYPANASLISKEFKKELASYETSKGTIRFPLGTLIPLTLIKSIVRLRAKQNLEKAKAKAKKK